MPSFDHPVLKALLIILAASGLTQLYVYIAGYFNWPPFYTYPAIGSQPWIIVYTISLFAVGGIWFLAHRVSRKDSLTQMGVTPAR